MKILEGFVSGEPAKPYVASLAYPGWDWEIYHKPLSVNIEAGTIQAGFFFKDNVGQAGLAFYVQNVSYSHWQMYTVYFDAAANQVKLDKWLDGTRTNLGSLAFAIPLNTSLWLGADFSEHSSNGTIRVHASAVEGNLIRADTLKLTVTDSSLASTGSVGIVRSNSATFRTMDFTAGSPAHAEVADEAKALRGPILGDNERRVRYNNITNEFEYSDDGLTWTPVNAATATQAGNATTAATATNATQLGGVVAANYLQRKSVNRPGVDRIYRRDDDSGYNVQTHWTGSHWWLRGYNGDTFHAECRVGYADYAGSAPAATAINRAFGVNLNTTSGTVPRNSWYYVSWTDIYLNTGSAFASWSAGNPNYVFLNETGLYTVTLGVGLTGQNSTAANMFLGVQQNGGWIYPGGFSGPFTSYDGGANHYGQITLTFYATTGDNFRAVVWWKTSNYNANLMATWTRMIFTKN